MRENMRYARYWQICDRMFAISWHAWLTVDSLSAFCGVPVVQCVMLMLRIFEFVVSLFDGCVYRQNVTCLKCFARYGR